MTYRFDLNHRSDGSAPATCGEHQARDARALARAMVNAGCADAPLEAGRPGRTDYRAASLHAFAAMSLSEGDRGFRLAVYAPHPEAQVSRALQNAISRCAVAAKNRRQGVNRP
jgi:hypothetical protein